MIHDGYDQSSQDLLEDFVELGLLNLSVSGLVNSSNELVDFSLGNSSVGLHVLEGIVDEVEDLVGIEGVAFVCIVLREDGVNGLDELGLIV